MGKLIIENKKYLLTAFTIILFVFSLFLRIYKLDEYPMQINQDELSNIYDGYSIAETGADRWGQHFPIILRGFGEFDFRPPLNAWLCAGSIKILGFSIIAGRLPSAIIGFLSLILVFLVAKKIGKPIFAFFAILFVALSPWHLLFSRMAHEGAILPPFFMILAFYLWLKLKETNYNIWYMIFLGLCTGLATNAYQSTKLIFFILAIFFSIDIFRKSGLWFRNLSLFAIFTALGALPQIFAAITIPEHFFTRATNGTINQFSFSWAFLKSFFLKFYVNLDPQYLFFSFGEFNNLSIGRLLTVEFLFFYIGLIVFYFYIKKTKIFNPSYLYFFIFVAILPSALTPDNPHSIRASCTMVLFPLVSAATVAYIYEKLNRLTLQNTFVVLLTLGIFLNFTIDARKYLNSKELQGMGQQTFAMEVNSKIPKYTNDQRNVYIEDFGNMIYLYTASFCGMSPQTFQKATKKYEDNGFGGDHFTQLGKYNYLNINQIDSTFKNNKDKYLIVLQSKSQKYNLVDSLNLDGQKVYYYKN